MCITYHRKHCWYHGEGKFQNQATQNSTLPPSAAARVRSLLKTEIKGAADWEGALMLAGAGGSDLQKAEFVTEDVFFSC